MRPLTISVVDVAPQVRVRICAVPVRVKPCMRLAGLTASSGYERMGALELTAKPRKPKQQRPLLKTEEIAKPASHLFYAKVYGVLNEQKFDRKVEHLCRRLYKPVKGRQSLAPGVYLRLRYS